MTSVHNYLIRNVPTYLPVPKNLIMGVLAKLEIKGSMTYFDIFRFFICFGFMAWERKKHTYILYFIFSLDFELCLF